MVFVGWKGSSLFGSSIVAMDCWIWFIFFFRVGVILHGDYFCHGLFFRLMELVFCPMSGGF